MTPILWVLIGLGIYAFLGLRIVRQNERVAVETLGKFSRMAEPGLVFVFLFFQRIRRQNITEQMTEIDSQEMITEDKLNCKVDLVIFYKVKTDSESIFNSLYNVYDFENQIVTLGQTTARNVIGGMPFKDVNSERNELNSKLAEIMKKETKSWGVDIIRVELKEIVPPRDVQDVMNKVLKAENEKRANIDFATAAETEADGIKRAAIKSAEGFKQAEILKAEGSKTARILQAEGEAKYNELISKSFTGNVQLFKRLEVTQNSLKDNAKIILTDKGINPTLLIGDLLTKEKK